MNHHTYMRRCLELAERGRGLVGINPLVGSVLVRRREMIAEGWHAAFGSSHAERNLINKFDQAFQQEDVLYVNLEPCCFPGKTLPCTDLIVGSGIKNVVYGMEDPNPAVAGRGIEQLRTAGIHVEGPVLPELCRRCNRGFVSLQEQGRPYVTLKHAQTVGGEIASVAGSKLKITSRGQDVWSHTFLRATHDAILVGVQTVVADDPLLTVRSVSKKFDQIVRHPLRLILDPELRTPLTAQVVSAPLGRGTIILAGVGASHARAHELLQRGVRIFQVPLSNGIFSWHDLWSLLTTPIEGFSGITSVLVEGGAKTWQYFRGAKQYDEEVVLVGAPA